MRDLPPRPNQNAIQGVNQPNQAGVVNKFPPTTQHPASFQKPQNGSLLNTQNPQNVGTPLNNEVPPSPSTNQVFFFLLLLFHAILLFFIKTFF